MAAARSPGTSLRDRIIHRHEYGLRGRQLGRDASEAVCSDCSASAQWPVRCGEVEVYYVLEHLNVNSRA